MPMDNDQLRIIEKKRINCAKLNWCLKEIRFQCSKNSCIRIVLWMWSLELSITLCLWRNQIQSVEDQLGKILKKYLLKNSKSDNSRKQSFLWEIPSVIIVFISWYLHTNQTDSIKVQFHTVDPIPLAIAHSAATPPMEKSSEMINGQDNRDTLQNSSYASMPTTNGFD